MSLSYTKQPLAQKLDSSLLMNSQPSAGKAQILNGDKCEIFSY